MCGIAGFTGKENRQLLAAMTDAIRYRGPDAEGFFANGEVNFGHRRLSIIDLSTGAQPMLSADKKIAVMFNGEIYNYRELKQQYLSKYNFTTTSDTEVIIYLYQELGESFLEKMNGMFAIALWDNEQKKLLLARDRMGKKPLYYTEQSGELFFASEPKALLATGMQREIDPLALQLYFQYQYIPGEHSLFKGIKKLLPGHVATWQQGNLQVKKYWQPTFGSDAAPSTEHLGTLIGDAVERRLVADVPLGIFLSGGLDSSTVAYYAAQRSPQKIKTFSIGFTEKSFDETPYFTEVAKLLKTDHYHQMFSAQQMLDCIPSVLDNMDEPLADASLFPTYLLSKFAREQVTVTLGGDGADELFAGYPTFVAHQLAKQYARLPQVMQRLVARGVSHLPVSHDNISFDFKLKQFLKGAHEIGYQHDIQWMAAFAPKEAAILSNEFRSNAVEDFETEFFGVPNDRMESVENFWQTGYLVDDILTKVDRAAMFSSLEVRAPFLDVNVVEYVNHLPFNSKLKQFRSKYLLKELMQDKLPGTVVFRQKKGFGIPIAAWLRSDLRELVAESTATKTLSDIGLFNVDYVQRLVHEHEHMQHDHRMKLWTLICFVQWYKRWMK